MANHSVRTRQIWKEAGMLQVQFRNKPRHGVKTDSAASRVMVTCGIIERPRNAVRTCENMSIFLQAPVRGLTTGDNQSRHVVINFSERKTALFDALGQRHH